MAGRPPIPISQHKARGTYRKDRHGKGVESFSGRIGDPPAWMTGAALEEWQRLTGHPQYGTLLSAVHRGVLVEYCVLHSRMIDDAQGISKMSSTDRQILNSLRMGLGITPASQCKLRLPEQKVHENQWAALRG